MWLCWQSTVVEVLKMFFHSFSYTHNQFLYISAEDETIQKTIFRNKSNYHFQHSFIVKKISSTQLYGNFIKISTKKAWFVFSVYFPYVHGKRWSDVHWLGIHLNLIDNWRYYRFDSTTFSRFNSRYWLNCVQKDIHVLFFRN